MRTWITQYDFVHELDVRLPGHLDRIEAARKAIKYARQYMQTLPPGCRLTQACPKRCADLWADGDDREAPHWIVRCWIRRTSTEIDLGWEDLLDLEAPAGSQIIMSTASEDVP